MQVVKKITLVIPSFTSGGAERVISQIAIYFAQQPNIEVALVCLIKGPLFYQLPPQVKIVAPDFEHRQYNRAIFTYKIFRFLRKYLISQRPDTVLSFGGKYNSFVLMAAMGSGIPIFVSDRSRPTISYGRFLDWLNPIMYRRAAGIIAQTSIAKEVASQKTNHRNIAVIGNPIRAIAAPDRSRENIILNVGRFIKSKHQVKLVEYFANIRPIGWQLVFLGEGQYLQETKQRAIDLGIDGQVVFAGTTTQVDDYYRRAKIFAFTSTSEGFPNALGEALSAGLACISFNCVAGPSDLIEEGINGFLVPELVDDLYIQQLKTLIENESLQQSFSKNALINIQRYRANEICEAYLKFILQTTNEVTH